MRGFGGVAIALGCVAFAGAAMAQHPACVVARETLQFCAAPAAARSDCACTDWAGKRVDGFVDPSLIERLRAALDRGWFQPGSPNERWLQSQAALRGAPPQPVPFWCKPEHLDRWGPVFLFAAPEKLPRPPSGPDPLYPGIMPIGPWPPPPGWPPKQ